MRALFPFLLPSPLPSLLLYFLLVQSCTHKSSKEQELIAQSRRLAFIYQDIKQPTLSLHAQTSFQNYLTYSLTHNPKVKAAYFDWVATVENITIARSLEQPQLTFELDIQKVITSLMPGVLQELPGPGKLGLRALIETKESESKFFMFQTSLLQAAYELKRVYYEIGFVNEQIEINQKLLQLQQALTQFLRAQNRVDKSSLTELLQQQSTQEQLAVTLQNLLAMEIQLRIEWKGALGISPTAPNPPIPESIEYADSIAPPEDLIDLIRKNPRFRKVQADFEKAEEVIQLTYKNYISDFLFAPEVDLKQNPALWKLQFSMTLPIWQEKIRAEIDRAMAAMYSAHSRLAQEEIDLFLEYVQTSIELQIRTRNIRLLTDGLILNAQRSLDLAYAQNEVAQISFSELVNEQQRLLMLQIEERREKKEQQLILARLSLLLHAALPKSATSLDEIFE